MPRVSVAIASYNHEKYISECIQSVLNQTYQDFEIIITDDGSTDRTTQNFRQFTDARIHLDIFETNKGACTAINNSLRKTTGEYIAIINSDDAWVPEKLALQIAYLDGHPEIGAVFSQVDFIDECSHLIDAKNNIHINVFKETNKSRHAWLNRFFFKGNCLCCPSVLIRKKCFNDIGLFNERLAGLPDLDVWVRLCLKYDIHIMDEKLVLFRIRTDEANASGDRLPTHIRNHFEIMQILDHYLSISDRQEFMSIFPEATKYGRVENGYIPYFLGRLALQVNDSAWLLWGLQVLYDFMSSNAIEDELMRKYKFRYIDFIKLAAKYDIFNLRLMVPAPTLSQSRLIQIDPARHGKLVNVAVRMHNLLAGTMLKLYARIAGISK